MKLQYWRNSGSFCELRLLDTGHEAQLGAAPVSSSQSKFCSQFLTPVLNWKKFISNSGPVYFTIKIHDLEEPANSQSYTSADLKPYPELAHLQASALYLTQAGKTCSRYNGATCVLT